MRFAADLEWGNLLALIRKGMFTARVKEVLASRAFSNMPVEQVASDFKGKQIMVITPSNKDRHLHNLHFLGEMTKAMAPHGGQVYKIPAKIEAKESMDLQKVFAKPDSDTGKLPPVMYAYPGMPCRITHNQCIPKGVANGTKGTVYHIDWPEGTTFTLDCDGCCIPSREPVNIYVDVHGAPPSPAFPGLPADWPSSVVPIARETKTVKLDKGVQNSPSFRICQFPIIPAFAGTCHGVQGLTCSHICLANPRPQSFRSPDRHGLYVALSRVTTRHGLLLMEELRPDDFTYFRPSLAVLDEDTRLQQLACDTLQKLESVNCG